MQIQSRTGVTDSVWTDVRVGPRPDKSTAIAAIAGWPHESGGGEFGERGKLAGKGAGLFWDGFYPFSSMA